jgi:AcrR family transcriptional regulator
MARRTLRNLDERILNQVIRYGAEEPIGDISTKKIASELRISEPTIYVHYKTKDNLLLQAYKKVAADLYDPKYDKAYEGKDDADTFQTNFECLLLRSGEKGEEVLFAFNYRHSKFWKGDPAQKSQTYDATSRAIEGIVNGGTSGNEAIDHEIVEICIEELDFLATKVARGEVEPTPTNVKLMSSMVLATLSGVKDKLLSRLSSEEKKQLLK